MSIVTYAIDPETALRSLPLPVKNLQWPCRQGLVKQKAFKRPFQGLLNLFQRSLKGLQKAFQRSLKGLQEDFEKAFTGL